MTNSRFPRLILAGTGSGCGKTTVTAALLQALTDLGQKAQPFKAGPDYIDPMFHRAACGRASANLDSWLLKPETARHLFRRRMKSTGADLGLIEGVMGYYDGLDDELAGSTARLAEILDAPVVLLADGHGLGLSICAMIQGYQNFNAAAGRRIAGVILNGVGASGADYLGKSIAKHCGIPVLGFLPELPDCRLESRHLGLVPAGEDPELSDKISRLADQAQKTIDLPALLRLAGQAAPLPESEPERVIATMPEISGNIVRQAVPVRLGVALDQAFNFYYADNFDLLQDLGAQLVFFSPLQDAALPENLDGLYLGGGYPEIFAAELGANADLCRQIREQVLSGLPTVAECGGLIYLCRSLTDRQNQSRPMCGVLPAQARMTDRLQRFGYQTLTLAQDGLLGHNGEQIRVHEFHYSTCDDYGQDCLAAKPDGRSWPAVHHTPSAWIGYPHLHFWSNPAMAMTWLQRCRTWQGKRHQGADEGLGEIIGGARSCPVPC